LPHTVTQNAPVLSHNIARHSSTISSIETISSNSEIHRNTYKYDSAYMSMKLRSNIPTAI